MLVLSRKADEKIVIGRDITVTVLRVQGRVVKIGVEAPEDVAVLRSELLGRPSPRERGTPRPHDGGSDDESSPRAGHRPPPRRTPLKALGVLPLA